MATIFAPETQRIPMADQNEFDVLTGLHHSVHYKAGTRKGVKRKYHRRWRKLTRLWVQNARLI